MSFTPFHRGGAGPPLVCLQGFADTWRIWELVLPALERHHEVLALTLAGHAGGPPIEREVTEAVLADAVARAMDEAGSCRGRRPRLVSGTSGCRTPTGSCSTASVTARSSTSRSRRRS